MTLLLRLHRAVSAAEQGCLCKRSASCAEFGCTSHDLLQWVLTTQLIAGLLSLICDLLIRRLSKLKNDIRRQEGDAGGTFEAMEVEHLP